jgi:hypothetical protein
MPIKTIKMDINNEIKKQLNKQLNKSIKRFKAFKHPHILFTEIFAELDKIDKEAAKKTIMDELEHNCINSWTNPEEGVNPNEQVEVFLFEYDDPCALNAAAYGIVGGKGFKIKSVPYYYGGNYDFVSGLDATYGINLTDILSPLYKIDNFSVVNNEKVPFYEKKGYTELVNAFLNTAYLILHDALSEFVKGETFKKINRPPIFKILIGEHDCAAQPIYFVYDNEKDILAEIKAQGESIDFIAAS